MSKDVKKVCKHCDKTIKGSHYCHVAERDIDYDDDNSFIISAIIGAATDSALLGGLLGGDLLGGIAGDLMDGDLFD